MQFKQVVQKAKQNTGVAANAPPLPDEHPLTVPDLTPDQQTIDSITRYNSGAHWHPGTPVYVFDASYVLGPDKTSVVLVGYSKWIHRKGGTVYTNKVKNCGAAGVLHPDRNHPWRPRDRD